MAPETPKGVSSRLLTMKFMQRAAASASSSGSPETDTPSAKKRKLEHSTPEGRFNVNIDQASIKAALEQQEATRQAALRAHETEDTHWVLDTTWTRSSAANPLKKPLNIVYVGYGDTDAANDSDSDNDYDQAALGRTSFRPQKPGSNSNEQSQDEDDSSEESSNEEHNSRRKSTKNIPTDRMQSTSRESRSRSGSRSRPTKENIKAKELRNKRRKKEVQLSKLTSISSRK